MNTERGKASRIICSRLCAGARSSVLSAASSFMSGVTCRGFLLFGRRTCVQIERTFDSIQGGTFGAQIGPRGRGPDLSSAQESA